jgi:predicted lipid-binding transport protein (Tim44 family)
VKEQPLARAPLEADTGDIEEGRPRVRAAFTGPAAAGLEAIAAIDATFSPEDFTKGARRAYELIVTAFADGDRDALRPLVDDDVFEVYSDAIKEREAAGTDAVRLARLKSARIVDAEVQSGDLGRVMVSFEAEVSDGDLMRTAREVWTFKRPLKSANPNWLLDEVTTAS